MNVKYEKKLEMTFIGLQEWFPNEGQKFQANSGCV